MNAQRNYDEDYAARTPLERFKDFILGPEVDEGEESVHEDEEAQDSSRQAKGSSRGRRQPSLHVATSTRGRVAIRLNAISFDDAKVAADGLKNGEQQIINLEKATPQMAQRIIDFLNGTCHALDGAVERIGENVYMFVPANVAVEVDMGATASAPAPAPTPRRPAYGE